jgi:hypothetical protein
VVAADAAPPIDRRPAIVPSVFVVEAGGEGVLLDLKANRYVGLGPTSTRIWTMLERGASIGEIVASERARDELADPQAAVVRQLGIWQAQGWVDPEPPTTIGGGAPLPARRGSQAAPRAALEPAELARAPLDPRAIALLLAGVAWERYHRERTSLPDRLVALQRTPPRRPTPDRTRLLGIVRAYHTLRRPLLREQDCLPRSLALARTLRWSGFDAEVCFGVQKFPFQAHAWVELDGVVCNDTLEIVVPHRVVARF